MGELSGVIGMFYIFIGVRVTGGMHLNDMLKICTL